MNLKFTISIIASVVILAMGVVGMKIFGQKPEVAQDEKTKGPVPVDVVTSVVSAWNEPLNIQVDGEAVTYRVVAIGAEVEGRIVEKTEVARGGTFVHKGAELFKIDSTKYQLEIDRLKAQRQHASEELAAVGVDLESGERLIALANEDWELQKKNLARMKELLRTETANDSEVEAAMKQELVARNTLQTLENNQKSLAQLQKTKTASRDLVTAQLKRAELDLKRCVVTSTLEGRIVADEREEGDYIKPGEILVHVSDGSKMEIKCQLRSEELAWVWQQKQEDPDRSNSDPLNLPPVPCEIGFTFENVETIWEGYIARLEGTGIDRDTRTFPCRVVVDEPQKTRIDQTGGRPRVSIPTLLAGMYVSVRIPVLSPVPLLRVPLESVRPGGQIWVKQNDRLKIRSVSVAHVEDDAVFVRQMDSGLAPGDRVIVSPLPSVRNGMLVREASDETIDQQRENPAAEEPATPDSQQAAATAAESDEFTDAEAAK